MGGYFKWGDFVVYSSIYTPIDGGDYSGCNYRMGYADNFGCSGMNYRHLYCVNFYWALRGKHPQAIRTRTVMTPG
jgi:hypothetical protein